MSLRRNLRRLGQRLAGIPAAAAAPEPVVLGPGPRALRRSRLRAGQLASASSSAAGGLPAQRLDQVITSSTAGVAPGTASGTFRGRLVLVFGSGAGSGIFVYSGTPGAGNPPVLAAVAPGVTTDPYGNTVGSVLTIGTFGGPGMNVDQFGNLTVAGADGSLIELAPEANLPLALTSVITGIMNAVMVLHTLDTNETQRGVVSGVMLGSGSTATMGTLITSPYAAEGMGLLLQAQNDGATNTPFGTFGTVTTQGGTLTFAPVLAVLPGALLLYSGGGTVTVVTKTSGSGTIPIPVGVTTAKGEAWGAGASSAGVSGGASALGGNGGGAYAAEPSLAVASGGTVSYSVPASANSPGGSPAACTLTGSAVTVQANSGTAGTGSGAGAGGTAGGNTVAFAGGRGGAPSAQDPGGGGGGGGSASPAGAGNHGDAASPTQGGAGGVALNGGGGGGKGGSPTGNGSAGSAPGGGGGGGSTNADGAIGGAGQVRLTYTTGAPSILASFAAAAGTDQFGTAYKAGNVLGGPGDGGQYNSGPFIAFTTANSSAINSTTPSAVAKLSSIPVAAGSYMVRGVLILIQGTVTSNQIMQLTGPAESQMDIEYLCTEGTGINASGVFSALASNVNMGAVGANTTGEFRFSGPITFTAAGDLGVSVACSVAADTWVLGAGSYIEVTPIVAT